MNYRNNKKNQSQKVKRDEIKIEKCPNARPRSEKLYNIKNFKMKEST